MQRQKLKDSWEEGAFSLSNNDATEQVNAKMIGKCEAYLEVDELDFESISETLYEE